ncbi:MAG: cytosolic protein [Pseudomonadota bacterium]
MAKLLSDAKYYLPVPIFDVEIQGQKDADFAKRMYVYNYRIFDRYERAVASMAVLADNQVGWRPDHYSIQLFGCETGIRFPVVKLLDYADQWEDLKDHQNPFAVAVMAHLKTRETRKDLNQRKTWKLLLIKTLYEKGYPKADILNLFRFIDWMMNLPDNMEKAFWEEVQQYEEDKHMPYVTSVEKIGYQRGVLSGKLEGRLEGLREGIALALQIKFGSHVLRLIPRLQAIGDYTRLETIKEVLKTAKDIKEIESLLNEQ